jgi:multicomponent Na+:H+ antiporter subunit A
MIARTSPIVRLAVQAATPIALLIAVYVLFVGHNAPGGGFAAGLMLGAVIVLRTIAGIQQPRYAFVMLSAGGMIVAGEAFAPMLWGQPLLDQVTASWEVPVLGKVKVSSALVFDVGVLLVVAGLITALLDGFDATSLVDRGLRPDLEPDTEPDAEADADAVVDTGPGAIEVEPRSDGDRRAGGGQRT